MQIIPLLHGLFAQVDDEDYKQLSAHKWFIHRGTATNYAYRVVRRQGQTQTNILMHREILKLAPMDGNCADHIDFNGLNNQKHNLRILSRKQNAVRQPYQKHSSIFLGVHWYKRDSKWMAYVHINYKKIHLGYFASEEEAAQARDLYVERHDKTGLMALNKNNKWDTNENNYSNSEQKTKFLDDQRTAQLGSPEA